jgi:hypothetical protein
MSDKAIEDAFCHIVDAVDEAWQLVRKKHANDWHVDPLSSLSDPRGSAIESVLLRAEMVVQSIDDRAALIALAGAARAQDLISEAALDRVVAVLEKS